MTFTVVNYIRPEVGVGLIFYVSRTLAVKFLNFNDHLFTKDFYDVCCSTNTKTVHLGVCHANADCPTHPHPGPCGCPDCNKPHPPHFQHSYCENLSAVTSEEETTAEDSTGADGENGTNAIGQTGSSRFNGWIILAAAAAACAAIGAAVMRKRVRAILRSKNCFFLILLKITLTIQICTVAEC
jgi:hypothetical protein